MNPADLATMLDLMAQALRTMPSAGARPAAAAYVPAAGGRTLADWLDIHEAAISERGYKTQTVRNRTANLRHLRRIWGATPIAELRPREISAGLREFLPLRSSTAQRVLSELRDALSEAVANDWIDRNHATHVKMPAHQVQRKRLTFDTWCQMRTLAKTSPQSWLECLLLLALVTGQRRADLAAMRFDDVVDGHLQVEQQKEAGKGYGARVAIPLTLRIDAIGMTLADVIDLCRQSGAPGHTLLRQANGRDIELSSLSNRFAECRDVVLGASAGGSKQRPTLHEVRSLAARQYVQQGMPATVVQTLLGHKDLDMTTMYTDDRGLSAKDWKRVQVAQPPTVSADPSNARPHTIS